MRVRWVTAVLLVTASLSSSPIAAADPLGADLMYADVVTYAGLAPTHLSGTADESRTQQWVAGLLAEAGVQTRESAYTFSGFIPRTVSLTIDGHGVGSLAPRFSSGTTGPAGIDATMVWAGYGTRAEVAAAGVAGKIAVVDVPHVRNTLAPTLNQAETSVEAAGALALVAVTEGPGDYPVNEDVDSRNGTGSMPTLFVGRITGAGVIDAARRGASATFVLDADTTDACDTNVIGILPGADPNRWIVIGTPTSAFVRSAAERGPGVAILLGLARHYASLQQADRPVGLVFAALSGHEVGFLGLPVLMQANADVFSMTEAYVHLGASIAAIQRVEGPDGDVIDLPAGDSTRALYVSENPLLEPGVAAAFAGAMPVGAVPPAVLDPGEQNFAYHAGLPIVAESGSHYYFHTAGDLPDGVSKDILAGMARGFQGSIDYMASLPPGALRAANQIPSFVGGQKSANATPGNPFAAPGPKQPVPVVSCADRTPTQAPFAKEYAFDAQHPSAALGVVAGFESPQAGYAWEGRWQAREVQWLSSRTGARLYGVAFAPDPLPSVPGPAVVIVPGSGSGVQSFYQWAARDLAGHGYVALTVDPQGVGRSETFGSPPCSVTAPTVNEPSPCGGVPFQQSANYVDAAHSGIDFLLSDANPFVGVVDPSAIGAAGHSLGARAVSWLQGEDARIDAVVAWDNLASDLQGDAGSPSGGGVAGTIIGGSLPGDPQPVTPRVPALGQASDRVGTTTPTNRDPEQKKTAFAQWRAGAVPSMEVVFRGATHFDWAQTRTADKEQSLYAFEWYTRAWFDLWLRGDGGAVDRLMASSVGDVPRAELLSAQFRSAAYLPGSSIDCADLSAC